MGLPQPKEFWTVEEYLEFEKTSQVRHEYVDGQIYLMDGDSKNHNRIAGGLGSLLNQHLADSNCEAFIENVKLRVRPTLFYYPDVVVTCGPVDVDDEDDYVIDDPVLVVEVLSKSTARIDRTEKLREYQYLPNLREYVLVINIHRPAGDNHVWVVKESRSDLQLHILNERFAVAADKMLVDDRT